MLSRQHIFYQQFLQLVDAAIICACLWGAHSLLCCTSYSSIHIDEGTFRQVYWMMALSLPLGPILLDWMRVYELSPASGVAHDLWLILKAMYLLLLAIIICVIVFHVPQATISRTALEIFLIYSVAILTLRVELTKFLFSYFEE